MLAGGLLARGIQNVRVMGECSPGLYSLGEYSGFQKVRVMGVLARGVLARGIKR